jgi:hypothetical protein
MVVNSSGHHLNGRDIATHITSREEMAKWKGPPAFLSKETEDLIRSAYGGQDKSPFLTESQSSKAKRDELEDMTPIEFVNEHNRKIAQMMTIDDNEHNHKILEANKILDKRVSGFEHLIGLDAAFEQAVTHCTAAAS